MRILFVITTLVAGGAETMMAEVALRGKRDGHDVMVISLRGDQPLGVRLREGGIPVHALDMSTGWPDPRAVLRLAGLMRSFRPDLVQTWMYHADLLGGLATLFSGRPPLAWAIHHTAADIATLNPRTYQVLRWNARLSHWLPNQIICCADSARATHIAAGYCADRMSVIPNGVDVARFQPKPAARSDVRRELGLAPETFLVGLCARFHPTKDHGTFVKAAALLHRDLPDVHFLLCGTDVDENNHELTSMLDDAGIRSSCHLLGQRSDLPQLLPALDVLVSSSRSEAFSLVIVEAMACGVPCAVTDVGDSALIVGETGRVALAGDAPALAAAVRTLIASRPGELGTLARQRVESLYNLELVTSRYWTTYEKIVRSATQ